MVLVEWLLVQQTLVELTVQKQPPILCSLQALAFMSLRFESKGIPFVNQNLKLLALVRPCYRLQVFACPEKATMMESGKLRPVRVLELHQLL